MSKRRQEQGQGQGTGKRLRKQKHLYLVLDDWAKGFSIHKIDIDTANPHLGDPVLRLVSPVPYRDMSFVALGSNIFTVSNKHHETLVYDTETAALAIGPRLPDPLLGGVNNFVSAADTLYAFAYFFQNTPHSFEVMSTAGAKQGLLATPTLDWSWQSVPSPPPFKAEEVIGSYALHPDGHTIFISANRTRKCERTFSFDTRHCEWRYHGEWSLPFKGKGVFDSDLDAWVGLHWYGGICSCQVISHSSTSAMRPEWKMVKDELWSRDKVALMPTLTYMGGSRFCIVAVHAGQEYEDAFGHCDGRMLDITMFGLRYSHKGELKTIGCTTNSYLVSKHLSSFSPVAFWM